MAPDLTRRLRGMPQRTLPCGGRVFVATTLRHRLLGLMGVSALPPGSALLFPHCDSVHTGWMRMAIDVVFLDDGGRVLEVRRSLPPWRVTCCRGAASVLEVPAGGADRLLVSGRCCRAVRPA